jgi:hypothetical protein
LETQPRPQSQILNEKDPDITISFETKKRKTKPPHMDVHVTMPTETYAASHAPSPILTTSPLARRRDRRVPSTRDEHDHVELSSCQESYRLFKRCSMADKTVGYSCSDAVASYMRCALNDCQ